MIFKNSKISMSGTMILTLSLSLVLISSYARAASVVIPDPNLPDTVTVGSVQVGLAGTVAVPITFANDETLGGMQVVLTWDSPDLTLDSFSFVGGRTAYTDIKGTLFGVNTVIIYSIPFSQPDIPIGSGLFGKLHFSYPVSADAQIINIDSITVFGPGENFTFFTDGVDLFIPQFQAGTVELVGNACCIGLRGNANNSPDDFVDLNDLITIVQYLFQSGPEPVCLLEANVNGSSDEMIDINDILYLVAYLFQQGPPPLPCP